MVRERLIVHFCVVIFAKNGDVAAGKVKYQILLGLLFQLLFFFGGGEYNLNITLNFTMTLLNNNRSN